MFPLCLFLFPIEVLQRIQFSNVIKWVLVFLIRYIFILRNQKVLTSITVIILLLTNIISTHGGIRLVSIIVKH